MSRIADIERLIPDREPVALDWSQRCVEGGIVIRLAGELDLLTARELECRLLAVAFADSYDAIRLDLSGVTFIDAHNIGTIVRAWTVAGSRGRPLWVHGLRGVVAQLFALLGLESMVATEVAVGPGGAGDH